MRLLACTVVLMLSGCLGSAPGVQPEAEPTFSGDLAYQWVHDIVYDGDQLRPRVPGHPGHGDTADWLEDALGASGWTVGRQDFTGADVRALDGNPAAPWEDNCSDEEYDEFPSMELTNLWATFGRGERTIALAAHWDAKEDTQDGGGPVPAANDGASGMGVILEFQRMLSNAPPDWPFQVAVLFFDAEDGFEDCHPLAGSFYFAQTMPLQVDRLILLDMVGDPNARFPREGHSAASDPGLVDLVWGLAAERGMDDHFVDVRRSVLDDHLPFIDVGVPSIDIIDYARPNGAFPPYWHTADDDMNNIDAAMLQDMGELLYAVLDDERFVTTWN